MHQCCEPKKVSPDVMWAECLSLYWKTWAHSAHQQSVTNHYWSIHSFMIVMIMNISFVFVSENLPASFQVARGEYYGVFSFQEQLSGAHRNPRLLMCWLPSLERLFLAESSKLLEPSSLTTMASISPASTPSTYLARRRLSSLLRYVSNL